MKTMMKILLFMLMLVLLIHCEKEQYLLLETGPVQNITDNGADCSGTIQNYSGSIIISQGFCWSTQKDPTISDTSINDSTGSTSFACKISGLSPNTVYYVRAFATNNVDTYYGNNYKLKTYTSSVTDIDGNVYYSVTIGSQIWMSENLKTTTYNDGTKIPLVMDKSEWNQNTGPGYCYYDNDYRNKKIYGALYNYYTITGGALCPDGWHVATDDDWSTLINYVGGIGVSGEKLRSILHWDISTRSGSDEFNFCALPGGYRAHSWFRYLGECGYWWSVIESDDPSVWSLGGYTDKMFRISSPTKTFGYSVRCVKDN